MPAFEKNARKIPIETLIKYLFGLWQFVKKATFVGRIFAQKIVIAQFLGTKKRSNTKTSGLKSHFLVMCIYSRFF